MTETLEYELIEISFSFGYDLEREGPVSMCLHDDSTIIGNEPKPSIQYDADGRHLDSFHIGHHLHGRSDCS